jgi:hypothetical protein
MKVTQVLQELLHPEEANNNEQMLFVPSLLSTFKVGTDHPALHYWNTMEAGYVQTIFASKFSLMSHSATS